MLPAAASGLAGQSLPVLAKDLPKSDLPSGAPNQFASQAAADYEANMRTFGGRLSSDPRKLDANVPHNTPWQFDVAIVGSGYGASVIAARLASKLKPGKRLCLLERGREWTPGTFSEANQLAFEDPSHPISMPQTSLSNDNLIVLQSCGLGGASLVDFGVASRPDARVFDQDCWPEALRDRAMIDSYFDLAELELGMERWGGTEADEAVRLAAASKRLAARGGHLESPLLSIAQGRVDSRFPVVNKQGLLQRQCNACGECWKGCNVGAKSTLAMNYLTMAKRAGGEIFSQTEVHSIEKVVDYYRLHINHITLDPSGRVSVFPRCITCRVLILGAGTIGTTEILLRSQSQHFILSSQLGRKWNTNGDTIGLVGIPNTPEKMDASFARNRGQGAGPVVQKSLNYPSHSDFTKGVTVLAGNSSSMLSHWMQLDQRTKRSVEHSQRHDLMIGMGHGQAEGSIHLDRQGSAVVRWEPNQDYQARMHSELARVAEASGGRLHHNPMQKQPVLHALGGCCMADSPMLGVVNHKGQVFDTIFGVDQDKMSREHKIHEGLYICDSSVIPTSLGCSPQLTIASLAERTAQLITLEPKYADTFDF